jgi:hypothetical protein
VSVVAYTGIVHVLLVLVHLRPGRQQRCPLDRLFYLILAVGPD